MDQQLQTRLDDQAVKIEEIRSSVRKLEQYMKWTFWITLAVIVLPLIIMLFAVPALMSSYTSAISGYEGLL